MTAPHQTTITYKGKTYICRNGHWYEVNSYIELPNVISRKLDNIFTWQQSGGRINIPHALENNNSSESYCVPSRPGSDIRDFEKLFSRNHDSDTDAQMRETMVENNNSISDFKISDRVRIKKTGEIGIIVAIIPGSQYQIYVKDNQEPILSKNDIESISIYPKFVKAEEFLRNLFIFKFRQPLSNMLYSYCASKTNVEEYQFKPAIKFLSNPDQRMLIADEVGLGKTIEACIIYFELKARMKENLRRTLIVCPAGLKGKWQTELETRFKENFEVLDGNGIRKFVTNYQNMGPQTQLKGICSLELLRSSKLMDDMEELGIDFDFVVVDEAHHLRNPNTLSFGMAETLTNHSDAMLFLTATPVQLRSEDLYYLLYLLNPGEFESVQLFNNQLEPNIALNKALSFLSDNPVRFDKAESYLDQVKEHFKNNPYYKEACQNISRILNSQSGNFDRTDVVDIARAIQKTNPFSHIFTRSRRKDVPLALAKRTAVALNVELSPIEEEIYDTALKFIRAKTKNERNNVHILGMIQIERQFASSLGTVRKIYEEAIKQQKLTANDLVQPDLSGDSNEVTSGTLETMRQLLIRLSKLFDQLGDKDSKFDKFQMELVNILSENPDRKIVVYAFFKPTLRYLEEQLIKHGHIGVCRIDGDVPPKRRDVIIEHFKSNPDWHIMLSSDVGSEGIDLQFCDTMFNYDLPWNPMKVEQRIGRIDRYGQTSEKIGIVSLFLADTIEDRILQRLYERIGIFQDCIGELEPILGDIVSDLQADIISMQLTPQQEAEKIEDYLRKIANKTRDIEEFSTDSHQLIGQEMLLGQRVSDDIASGRYVSPNEIAALIHSYIGENCPGVSLDLIDKKRHIWNLYPNKSLKDQLLRFQQDYKNEIGSEVNDFLKIVNKKLPSESGHSRKRLPIPITFSSKAVIERPLLSFINIWHPLTRMAFHRYSGQRASDPIMQLISFEVKTSNTEDFGDYYFFIFCLETKEMIEQAELIPLVLDVDNGKLNENISKSFLKTIQENLSDNSRIEVDFDYPGFDKIRRSAFQYMANVKEDKESEAMANIDAHIDVRKDSISKTYAAKIRKAQDRYDNATDIRIKRMKEKEVSNLQAKLQSELAEVSKKKMVSVSYQPVAYGFVRFRNDIG